MKQKIYNLLMVEHKSLLENCFRKVFFSDSEIPAIKTFEDYLVDFYLYLYEDKPKYVKDDVKGYYLQQVKDEKALPGWLNITFRRFLLEENRTLNQMQNVLKEYRQDLASSMNSKPIDLTLMHVAFAIAWFNQNETSEDKYLFFRSAYKHFKGFYAWPDTDLDDEDVANVLDIKQGTLRTRTSRLCAKVKKMVYEVNDAYIASLNKQSLDIAKEIFETPNPDIESILERLLGEAERDLPQHEAIVKLRKEKRESMEPLVHVCCDIEPIITKHNERSKFHSVDREEEEHNIFENITGIFKKKSEIEPNIMSLEDESIMNDDLIETFAYNPEPGERIVKIFKELINEEDI